MILYLLLLLVIVGLVLYKRPSKRNADIKTLVRQSARWSVAAEQDENPMIAVLHANYGTGYLWALNDIATTSEIEQVAGIDYQAFRDEIVRVQDKATKKMAMACPAYAPKPSLLTHLGGEGV